MENIKLIPLTDNLVKASILDIPKDAHKGNAGKICIIAGLSGMPGAALLSSKAAFRSGAGLVYVTTKQHHQVIQTALWEAIALNVEDTMQKLDIYDAICIGPGMGANLNTSILIENILKKYDGPLVLDADALNAIAKSDNLTEMIVNTNAKVVMTPHIVEACRLLDIVLNESKLSREEIAYRISEKYRCVVVLKGADTIIANQDVMYVNTTGNQGLATAGTGDVLSGIITANLARLNANHHFGIENNYVINEGSMLTDGLKNDEHTSLLKTIKKIAVQDVKGFKSKLQNEKDLLPSYRIGLQENVAASVYIHGLAGDIAAKQFGYRSMMASDVVDNIHSAYKTLLK